jgi:uncharacterized RDD family membrane protein YckC
MLNPEHFNYNPMRRWASKTIDLFIVLVAMSTPILITFNFDIVFISIFRLFLYFVGLFVPILYYIFSYTLFGSTLGNKIARLKIINSNGSNVSGGLIFVRFWTNFLPPSDLYSIFSVYTTAQKISWQDKICGTRVVRSDVTIENINIPKPVISSLSLN